MIPKKIHYCWFGGKPLSAEAQAYLDSWKKYCPDYEIVAWNESNFDIEANTYTKEAAACGKWAFVSDYARLRILYDHGGIYMDTDVEVVKNLDAFLSDTAFSGFENDTQIPTGIMGAEKGSEWIGDLLRYYDDRHFLLPDGSMDTTTNVVTITAMTQEKYHIRMDNTLQRVDGALAMYPKEWFCPKDGFTGKILATKNTHTIHHFRGSWLSEEERKNRIRWQKAVRIFGKKLGTKIYQASNIYLRHDGSFGKAIKHFFGRLGKKTDDSSEKTR